MMKDEEDVAYHVVMHLANEGVDGILVANNGSTDATLARLELAAAHAKRDYGTNVVIEDDPEPGYYQSEKMTNLARMANRRFGAEWIVPFDADEIWYAPHSIRQWLSEMDSAVWVVHAELHNHFCTAVDEKEETPLRPNPFKTMVYRQAKPGDLPKVAFRYHPDAIIQMGNHGVTFPDGFVMLQPSGGLKICHFPYRNFEHFKRKAINGAAAYAATDLPETYGSHWRQYGLLLERQGEAALKEVWDRWFYFLIPSIAGMVYEPAPFMRWDWGEHGDADVAADPSPA
jgi:hypothetical protein